MAPHSSTLAWKLPWTEKPGRLQSMGSRRVRHDFTFTFTFTFHFHALEKEMATHSSVLAWRIPGMGEPGGLPSMGSHRVRHHWSDLVAAAGQERKDEMRTGFEGMVGLWMKRILGKGNSVCSRRAVKSMGHLERKQVAPSPGSHFVSLAPLSPGCPLTTPAAHCFLCPQPSISVRVLTGLPSGPLLISFTFPFTHVLTLHWRRNESSVSLVRIRISCGLVRMQILQVCVNIWYLFWGHTV